MLALLEEAAARGASLVVFPELAFTTFFPRWLIEGEALDHYFERGMPNPAVQPLFDRARALGIGFYVGYAELTSDGQRFNSSILVDRDGKFSAAIARCICRARSSRVPAPPISSSKALFRIWRSGISRFSGWPGLASRDHGHDDLQ